MDQPYVVVPLTLLGVLVLALIVLLALGGGSLARPPDRQRHRPAPLPRHPGASRLARQGLPPPRPARGPGPVRGGAGRGGVALRAGAAASPHPRPSPTRGEGRKRDPRSLPPAR